MGSVCHSKNKETKNVIVPEENKPINSNLIISQSKMVFQKKDNLKNCYKILDKIGVGSHSRLYKILHIETNQIRTIKIISKKYHRMTLQENERFLGEISIFSNLDHPNILKIFEYFHDEEFYYIIMENCAVSNLWEKLSSTEEIYENEVAIIMEQIFSAIFYIHTKDLIHNDIRPENIYLIKNDDNSLSVKLINFGSSALYQNNELLINCNGITYFTAPEAFDGKLNFKCDLWACGIIMYILLTGEPPFDGRDYKELKEKIIQGKISFEGIKWQEISKEAKNLITSLLRNDPLKRISAEDAWNGIWIQKNIKKTRKKYSTSIIRQNWSKFNYFSKKQNLLIAIHCFILNHSLASEMISDFIKTFKTLDKKGDFKLKYWEINECFRKIYGEDIGNSEFESCFKDKNLDNNDEINYQEFILNSNILGLVSINQNLKSAFDCFDLEGSGKITANEIIKILRIDLEIAKNEKNIITKIIKELDKKGDKMIYYLDIKDVLTKVIEENKLNLK